MVSEGLVVTHSQQSFDTVSFLFSRNQSAITLQHLNVTPSFGKRVISTKAVKADK
jgi:hypothetical protein